MPYLFAVLAGLVGGCALLLAHKHYLGLAVLVEVGALLLMHWSSYTFLAKVVKDMKTEHDEGKDEY